MEQATDYITDFDPMKYIETFYTWKKDEYGNDTCLVTPVLEQLHETFGEGVIKGKRLLDVGSGPSISSIVTATRYFEEIYLSDFVPRNLDVLHSWCTGKFPSLDGVVKHCLDIEHSSETVAERNAEIRKKVNGILKIDVRNSNPLAPNWFAKFDAIISCFCLECATESLTEYMSAAVNVVSLLKKNGKLVIFGALGLSLYTFGDITFKTAMLSEKDIRDIYKEAGLGVESLRISRSLRGTHHNFCLVATKIVY